MRCDEKLVHGDDLGIHGTDFHIRKLRGRISSAIDAIIVTKRAVAIRVSIVLDRDLVADGFDIGLDHATFLIFLLMLFFSRAGLDRV